MHPKMPLAFLATQGTLLAHGHLVIYQDTQVPLRRAALQQVLLEPLLVHVVVPPQVQDPALALPSWGAWSFMSSRLCCNYCLF